MDEEGRGVISAGDMHPFCSGIVLEFSLLGTGTKLFFETRGTKQGVRL